MQQIRFGISSFLIFLCLIVLLILPTGCENIEEHSETTITELDRYNYQKLQEKANEALTFCQRADLNTDFCILIDLSMHSGYKRFFIWDFETEKVTDSFLVSHGCCSYPWSGDYSKERARTSNIDGSHCSSLGKYKIGKRGWSNWGIHVNYLMHGLEDSNSNALKRQIVLHSWEAVSDDEVYPQGTPEGWGCPALSNNAMRIVDEKLKQSQKNVLMWILQ